MSTCSLFGGLFATALVTTAAAPVALAGAHHRQTNVDTRAKRVVDAQKMRRIYLRQGSRPYYVQVRRDGRISYRKLWRNTKRRLGRAKATQDVPAFLQRLDAWRAKRAALGGGRPDESVPHVPAHRQRDPVFESGQRQPVQRWQRVQWRRDLHRRRMHGGDGAQLR